MIEIETTISRGFPVIARGRYCPRIRWHSLATV